MTPTRFGDVSLHTLALSRHERVGAGQVGSAEGVGRGVWGGGGQKNADSAPIDLTRKRGGKEGGRRGGMGEGRGSSQGNSL